ncbi:MAG TPA: DUF4132 domain-containing protein [Steroidobacter sp.]|uniref:DUF4132 domain-containing protein n=1 Tax=Steroidobacter sp. TaxID=1978227 RepID=UPI002ED8F5B8
MKRVAAVEGTASIDWPTGGFQWTDEWRKALPIVRGIHVPPYVPLASPEDHPPSFEDGMADIYGDEMKSVVKAAGRPWKYWSATVVRKRCTRKALLQPDFELWLELSAQFAPHYDPDGMKWVTNAGRTLHGLPFILGVVLELWSIISKQQEADTHTDLLGDLRHSIAAADEKEYKAALAVASKARARDANLMVPCAYLFPHLSEWALECIERKLDDRHWLLPYTVLPPDVLLNHARAIEWLLNYQVPAALLQVHLHAERAFDLLVFALDTADGRDDKKEALQLLTAMHIPALLRVLIDRMADKEVRAALDRLSEQFPAAALKVGIEKWLSGGNRMLEGWTVRLALRKPEAWQSAAATLDAAGRSKFETLLEALDRPDADPAALPQLLRNPPWLQQRARQELPTLKLKPMPVADAIAWPAKERKQAAAFKPPRWLLNQKPKNEDPDRFVLSRLDIVAAAHKRVLRGEPVRPKEIVKGEYRGIYSIEDMMLLPEPAVLSLWNSFPAHLWYVPWDANTKPIRALLARYDVQALPGLIAYAQAHAIEGLRLSMNVTSAALVPIALHVLRNLKKGKEVAQEWIGAHARATAVVALPLAFGPARQERDNARFGLRWLMENGFDKVTKKVASEYGAETAAALQALLEADPLLMLPSKMPRLPSFFVAASFRRPELPDGKALPAGAVEYIANMLTFSSLDAPYAGIQLVRETCTPTSLAEFAWDVFDAWLAAGAPSKEGWAFLALGFFGNDETARRLAPRIREWPGQAGHARAVTGLDVLAAIGTDAALMHLNAIASKVKFKALQDRAREKIAAIAEARGLTAEELADRLVPDLGLDENGGLTLDFGPRQFHVSFDETLKPFVRDSQGASAPDLPKANKSDDAKLAHAAIERYKQLKKDAKAIASVQLVRFELAMVARRRWSAADFRLFFIEHPLTRHLAARLVWGVYRKGKMVKGFRVAEDWTLADEQDSRYELPGDATVGIAHVLEMSQSMQSAFGQILAEYEILQPFRQLGRETYALTKDELRSSSLTRFKDRVVATGTVLGLVNRGWKRGDAQDGGWVGYFSKTVDDEHEVHIELDPGTVLGDVSSEPKQRIPKVVLRKSGTEDQEGLVKFTHLDPIVASELLRDLELMAPFAA